MEFDHNLVLGKCLGLCRKRLALVKRTGRTFDECAHDLVSHVWMRWEAGKFDASRGSFSGWAHAQAASKLKDMARDYAVVERRDERVEKNAAEGQGKRAIISVFHELDGEPVFVRAVANRHHGGRLGIDIRLMQRAAEERRRQGCSWRSLWNEMKTTDLGRDMGFQRVPGLATFWRLRSRLERGVVV